MTALVLPLGTLNTSEDGLLTAHLPLKVSERARVFAWFDRLTTSVSRSVFLPQRTTDGPFGLEVRYPEETRQSESLAGRIAEWGQDIRVAIPQILDLARFAMAAAEEFAEARGKDAPVGPAFIRFLPSGSPCWKLVPVPLGETALADWAGSDPTVWLWASPRALLGPFANDPVRALGAALHQGLVGSLFPETLTRREQFSRLLHGRITTPLRLTTALQVALPTACANDGTALAALILDCLQPQEAARPTPATARSRFEDLARRLGTDALVRHWEREHRHDVAARLQSLQKIPELPPLPPGQSWSDITRQRLEQQDHAGALEAAWNALETDGPGYFRLYLGVVQSLAARLPRPVAAVQAALDRLMQQFEATLDEGDFLRVVHLKVRHLGATLGSELSRLAGPYESRWNEGTALLLRAWLQARQGQGFKQTSFLCREGCARFQAMPEGGGPAGVYACAYLYLLDGIAHAFHVAASGQVDYYADALDCFTQSFSLAIQTDAEELVRSSCRWLGWLSWLTGLDSTPLLRRVHLGARALLQSQGIVPESVWAGVPEIPLYDEAILFPL